MHGSHVSSLLKHFSNAVGDFQKGEWENCIAKSGKFIEAVLKALIVGAGQTLPTGRAFKADTFINGLAQLPATVHDSIRLTIPQSYRCLCLQPLTALHRENFSSARIGPGDRKYQRKGDPVPNPPERKAPTLITAATQKNIEERIRRRTYELYEARGREHGRDLDDWFRAESEITGKAARAAKA